MESEKVKDIKKALECCQGESLKSCEHCPYWNWCKEDDGLTFKSDILTLINELEEENSIIKSNPPIIAGRSVGKTIRAKLIDYDKLKQSNKSLKDRIAELEKENARLLDSVETVQSNRCTTKCELTKKALKQFAERLKSKDCSVPIHKGFILIEDHAIDETLEEFLE